MMYKDDEAARSIPCSSAHWATLRSEALRFAMQKISDQEIANDIVQDAIEQALTRPTSFAGRSTFKTWLFAIIKHKAADHHRRPKHVVYGADSWATSTTLTAEATPENLAQVPDDNNSPEAHLHATEFWAAIEHGLCEVPASARNIFLMRDVLGHDYMHISKYTQLSLSNCHVLLHRTRQRLKRKLLAAGY